MGRFAFVGSAVFALLASACGQSSDRPDNIHVSNGGSGGTVGGGGGGSPNVGGAPCEPKPGQGSTMTGNMITYNAFLSELLPFNGDAEIRAQGATCSWVTDIWHSSDPPEGDAGVPLFHLEGLKKQDTAWFHLYPQPNQGVYPTLIAANATSDHEILDGFGLLRMDSVDEVYTATGTPRDPKKGTMIVQLITPQTKEPVSGGEVDLGTAAAPAYPGLGGWQLGGQTDVSGVAVMLNATSKAFPGQSWTVNVTLSGVKQSFKCPAEDGAVTICWIGVQVGG